MINSPKIKICCCFFYIAFFSTEADGMTLQDALAQAYEGNPQLLAERAQLNAKNEEVNQAYAHYRPTAQLTASQGAFFDKVTGGTVAQNQYYSNQTPSRSVMLTLSETLYRGGRTEQEVQKALADVGAERAQLKSVEQKMFQAVTTDYCDVVRDDAKLQLQIQKEQFLSAKVASAEAQMDRGELALTDVKQAEAAHAQAVAQRLIAQTAAKKSRLNFRRDVGVDAGELDYPKNSLLRFGMPSTEEQAANIASMRNPDVINAEYNERAAENAKNDIAFQALPQFVLQGTAEHQDGATFKDEHENILGVSLRLSIPLYSGGVLESQTRGAEQTIMYLRSNLELARNVSVAQARSAWSEISADEQAIAAYNNQISANRLALEGVTHQQSSGERTVLDVLNSEQSLLQSEVDLSSLKHDEILAEFSLIQAMGQADAQSMNLRVKLFDPMTEFNDIKGRWFGFETKQ